MTYAELGQRTKAKYPQYASLSDEEVGQRVAQKYPQYQSQITEGSGNAITNFIPSLKKNAGDIAQGLGGLAYAGVRNAVPGAKNYMPENQTQQGLNSLIKGTVQKAIPGTQADEATANAVGQFYKDRYGGMDKIANTVNTDPVGALLDASTVLSMGGTAVAKTGQLSKTASLANAGSKVANAGKVIDPANALIQGAGVVNKGVAKIGKTVSKTMLDESKNLPLEGVRITPTQMSKFEKRWKQDVQTFIKDEGLSGDPVALAMQKAERLQTEYDDVLLGSNQIIKKEEFLGELQAKIDDLKSSKTTVNDRKKAKILEEDRDFYAEVLDEDMTVDELVQIRRAISDEVKQTSAFIDPNTANRNVILYRIINDVLYNKVPDGKSMGKKLSQYYDFLEKTEKTGQQPAKSRLRDFTRGAGTALVMSNPMANILPVLGGMAVSRAISSPKVLGAGSDILSATSKGVGTATTATTERLEAMRRMLEQANDAGRNTGAREAIRR